MKNMNRMRFAATAFGRGVRVMAEFDVAKARNRCQELQTSFAAARAKLAEHVQSGTGTEQELKALRDQIDRETREYRDLMGALIAGEQQMAGQVAAQFNRDMGERTASVRAAMGGFFRSAMTGAALTAGAMAALSVPVSTGANPGNGLLPITVSNQLITDLYGDEGFLAEITHSQIKGLRLPRARTTVTKTTAVTEAGADPTGHSFEDDTILFGRFPGRDMIEVPGAVMRGTDTELYGYVEAKLQEIHRDRVLRRMHATDATGNFKHMSVYDATVGIKTVSGETMYMAICTALADLPASIRRVARVAMQPMAYFSMIKELSNGAATLFGKPEDAMLGFKVVLDDYAAQPIVGDLKTIRVNYDDALSLKSDEDIKKDVITMVINGDYDIQIEDANRLRLVSVAGGAGT